MIKNYLRVSLRNLLKNKIFSFINVFGLSLAIACSIIVFLFVKNEITFDEFHSKADRIYRPYSKVVEGGREEFGVHTPFVMGKQLMENYHEVEAYTVLTSFHEQVYYDNVNFEEEIHVVGKDFFKMFDFEVLAGNQGNALEDPSGIVITDEMAKKYFGTSDVLGQNMAIQIGGEKKEYLVKLVLKDIPANSSIQFDFLISDHHLIDLFPEEMLTSWNMITGETFVMLREGVDPVNLTPKFSTLVDQVMGDELEDIEYSILLQPLMDIHLNTDLPQGNIQVSDPKYTYILSGIAGLILIIACINFITLSLGRSLSRSREIGIRKVSGASRFQVFSQFMSESILIAFLGLLIGLLLVFVTLPVFNELSGVSLAFSLSMFNLLIYIGLTILTGILAGVYPALVVSGFKPISILKGGQKLGRGKDNLGTILVTGQFVLTVFMIGCTLIMKSQLNFLQNKSLGFDKDRVVVVQLDPGDAKGLRARVTKGFEQSLRFTDKLKAISEINEVAVGSHTFERGTWTEIGYVDEKDQERKFCYNTVSANFIPVMGIEMVSGRNFDENILADAKRSIIVNESFVKAYGLEDPIGKRIPQEEFVEHEIIGVFKDFHFRSLHAPIEPLILSMNLEIGFSGAHNISIGSSVTPKLFIRLKENQIENGLAQVGKVWEEIYPSIPFEYDFIEDNLKEQYEKEQNLGKMVTSASMLTILVGCLGLFGLSILSFSNRLKEISIRKVLGATGRNIYVMLSRKFVILSLVALVISIPLTYFTMNNWLTDFEYKITIGPVIFVLAGLISLAISLITISYQGFNAINTNPASVLRSE